MRKILINDNKNEIIDDIDRKIIEIMQEDGRISDTELAKMVGVSNDTARRRREYLVKNGIIKIKALVDPKKFGYTFNIHLAVRTKKGVDLRSFCERISDDPNAYYIAISMGPSHHVLIHYRGKTNQDLYSFIEKLRNDDDVENVDVNVIFDVIKSGYHSVPL